MQILQDRQKWYGQGKRCAPSGIIQLPGSIGKSHSDVVISGHNTWMEYSQKQKADRHRDSAVAEKHGNASICPRVPAFAQPRFAPPDFGYFTHISEKSVNEVTSGGKTQGIQVASYDTNHGNDYDASKHGWQHPEARRQQEVLAGNIGDRSQSCHGEPSFSWSIVKSRDHIGYNGSMARGKIQSTANSMNVPDWFVGVRMRPGPEGYGPKFPAVDCEDGRMHYNTRTWEKGPNFSVIERRERPYSAPSKSAADKPGNGARPGTAPSKGRSGKIKASKASRPSSAPAPTLRKREAPEKPEYFDEWKGHYERRYQNDIRCKHGSRTCDMHPCHPHYSMITKGNLIGTGCVAKRSYAPASDYVTIDPKVPGAG